MELRSATLPAIIGLKLLAYRDRRPRGVVRDIQDAYTLLREVEEVVTDERILEECMERFTSGQLTYGEAGAYLLDRDVGATFQTSTLDPMLALIVDLDSASSTVLGDVQREHSGQLTSIRERLDAFRMGVQDSCLP